MMFSLRHSNKIRSYCKRQLFFVHHYKEQVVSDVSIAWWWWWWWRCRRCAYSKHYVSVQCSARRYKEITAVDVNRLHSAPLNYCFELANDILAPPKKAFVLLIIFSNHACLWVYMHVLAVRLVYNNLLLLLRSTGPDNNYNFVISKGEIIFLAACDMFILKRFSA